MLIRPGSEAAAAALNPVWIEEEEGEERLGMLCSQWDWVRPRMRIMSPLARGSLRGGAVFLVVDWGSGWGLEEGSGVGGGRGGLGFRRKSRLAPSEKEAMQGSGPRKRSSSLW